MSTPHPNQTTPDWSAHGAANAFTPSEDSTRFNAVYWRLNTTTNMIQIQIVTSNGTCTDWQDWILASEAATARYGLYNHEDLLRTVFYSASAADMFLEYMTPVARARYTKVILPPDDEGRRFAKIIEVAMTAGVGENEWLNT